MRVYKYELKRNCKQIFAYFIVFMILSAVITQMGANKVKSIYQEEKNFKNLESKLVKGYISYHQYGAYGMRFKYSPEPISAIFIESIPFLDITAFIDIGYKLYLYKEISSINAIEQNGYLDLSWFLKVIGSFLICIWGWKTFSDKDYLKFLISINKKWFKTEIIMARVTIILLGILLIYLQIIIQYLANGFSIDAVHQGVYLLVVFLVFVICLLMASLMGIKSTKKKKILLAVIWITFVMLLPELVKYYLNNVARGMIECKFIHESKKADIVKKVEKEALAKAERYPYKDKFKSDVENAIKYWNTDSKKIERLEKQLIDLLEIVVRKYQFLSSLTPITFLNSVQWEISSQGFEGHLKYHEFVMKKQRSFLKYIFEKLYFKGPNYGPVISFLKEGKNIFHYKSMLPGSFWFGVLWSLLIIFLLMWLNCRKLNNVLFRDEPEKINKLECTLSEGEINIQLTGYEPLKQHFFNYFAGKAEFKGDIVINTSKEIEGRRDYIFIYSKKIMDERFTKRELKMLLGENGEEKENWRTIIDHARRTGKILLMVEFFKDLRKVEIQEIIEYIEKERLITILLTSNRLLACSLIPGDKIQLMQDDPSV